MLEFQYKLKNYLKSLEINVLQMVYDLHLMYYNKQKEGDFVYEYSSTNKR